MRLILFALFCLSTVSLDYCSVLTNPQKIYLSPNEVQIVPLSNYIIGANLQFTSTAKIYPRQDIVIKEAPFKNYQLLSVDVSAEDQVGIGFAQTQNPSPVLFIAKGIFTADGSPPNFAQFKIFTVEKGLKCFDARIINNNYDAVYNCINSKQEDVFCLSGSFTDKPLCNTFPSFAIPSWRKNAVLHSKNNNLLISATVNENVSYLTIYALLKQKIVFNNVLDAQQLGLTTLSISDMVIKDQFIILSDISQNKIIIIQYTADNYFVASTIPLKQTPKLISVSNSLFVASNSTVQQISISTNKILKTYQLDLSDNEIISLTSNQWYFAITTTKNHYIYKIGSLNLKELFYKVGTIAKITMLSPISPLLYIFSPSVSHVISFNDGFIVIDRMQNYNLTAFSGDVNCTTEIVINQPNSNSIIQKNILDKTSFNTQSKKKINIQLKKYFGGANLHFKVQNGKLMQFDEFSFDQTPNSIYKIIEVDQNNLYYIETIDKIVNIFKCSFDDTGINCKLFRNYASFQKPILLDASINPKNQLVVGWSLFNNYASQIIFITQSDQQINSTNKQKIYKINEVLREPFFAYSSLIMNQYYAFFNKKTGNSIQIQCISSFDEYFIARIDQFTFSKSQIDAIGGFYPREIILSESPNVFYVRSANKLLKLIVLKQKVRLLSFLQISNTYVSNWRIIVSKNSYFSIWQNKIEQHSLIDNTLLKTMPMSVDLSSVQQNGDLVYVQSKISLSQDQSTIVLKMNQQQIDTQYYTLQKGASFVVGGSFVFGNGKATRLFSDPTVYFETAISNDLFKKNFLVKIFVQSATENTESDVDITVINYSTQIQENKNQNAILIFPQTASSIQIVLPMDTYFKGTLQDFAISCALCPKYVTLQTPFLTSHQFQFPTNAMASIDQNTIILISHRNLILIVSQQVAANAPLSIDCSIVSFSNTGSLICGSLLIKFDIQDKKISFIGNFTIPITIQNPYKLQCIENNCRVWSQGKIIEFDDKTFIVKDSTTFGGPVNASITDFQMYQSAYFVLIGSYGLCYNNNTMRTCIDLTKEAALQNSTLDDNIFQGLTVESFSEAGNLKIFIATSNSLHFALSLEYTNYSLKFVGVDQSYFRFGSNKYSGWHKLTSEKLYIGSVNNQQKVIYSVYNRSGFNVRPYAGIMVQSQCAPILQGRYFYSSDMTNLQSYELRDGFNLALNYNSVKVMDSLTILASNEINAQSHAVKVQFIGNNDGGVKWYVIVISVAAALLLIAIAFGVYLYLKKKKKTNQVSLVTQGEDIDEEV